MFASGGALLHSPAWTQMMADALGAPVQACLEKEATSRGAALLALERIGAIPSIGDCRRHMGDRVRASSANTTSLYADMLAQAESLYQKLFEEK